MRRTSDSKTELLYGGDMCVLVWDTSSGVGFNCQCAKLLCVIQIAYQKSLLVAEEIEKGQSSSWPNG